MKKLILLIFTAVMALTAGEGVKAKISSLSKAEIDAMLAKEASSGMTVTDRIAWYSELFLGMPYSWTATGDGPDAQFETWPLMDLDSTNCMVYCEHVLALSISDSWDNFFNNLQQIRYKDGIIGMRTRNHYTMADWLPENSWLLQDVSAQVAGEYKKDMTRTISHEKFFRDKGITDMRYVKEDRTITLPYVPKEHLKDIRDNLRNGDIIALLFANQKDIFSAHMMMVIVKDGKYFIRESSTSRYSTFETPWEEWVKGKGVWRRYAGVAVMRVRDNLNTPDRVILPWDIRAMRNEK